MLFPSVSLLDGETVHVRMWLQHSFSHAFKSQCRRPCRLWPTRPRPFPATTPVASQVWWAAGIKQMFTNDLTRGSICLQNQCAATLSCAVSWAWGVSKPHQQSPDPEFYVAPQVLTSHRQTRPWMAANSRMPRKAYDSIPAKRGAPYSLRLQICQESSY